LLVVCYTNHALDQFLDGLCAVVRGRGAVVRVGGRSRSARLATCLLKELRKNARATRTAPRRIFLNRVEARTDMELQQVISP